MWTTIKTSAAGASGVAEATGFEAGGAEVMGCETGGGCAQAARMTARTAPVQNIRSRT
jgi:hypothetical protein